MPLAVLTDKAFGPPDHLQVWGTRCVIRKKLHKVWQGSRECKFGNHNAEMISDSSLGSNRISMEFTFRFNRRFYPFNAFRSLLGIAGYVTAPTYAELYAAKSRHTTTSGCL